MDSSPDDVTLLIQLVDAERYEEALGVPIGDGETVEVVGLKSRYVGNLEALSRIHFAEARLRNEKLMDRLLRFRNIGSQLMQRDKHAQAVPYYEQAVRLYGLQTDHLFLGLAHMCAGNYRQSVQPLEQALAREDLLDTNLTRGWLDRLLIEAFLKLKDFTKVQHHAQQAAKKGHADAEIGAILCGHGQFALSVTHLQRAVDQGADALTHFYLATAFLEVGRYEEAKNAFEYVLQRESDLPSDLTGVTDLCLSQLYELRHDPKNLLEYLQAAAKKGNLEAKKILESLAKQESQRHRLADGAKLGRSRR